MFQDEAHHRSPHVNAKLYIDGKEVNGFFPLSAGSIEKAKFLFTNGKSGDVEADDVIDDADADIFNDADGDASDEPEVFLVAQRPSVTSNRRPSWISRRMSSKKRKNRQLLFSTPGTNTIKRFYRN